MTDDLIRIASGALSAAINPHGAELTHLRDAEGHELMTNADPTFWTGHAPILFPIVGRLDGDTLHIDGKAYAMKQHGFARHSRFDVVAQDADHARFRLTDNAETHAQYPFAFTLDLDFALAGTTLTITATIANPGDVPLPASFGFHPAFAWPLPYGQPRGAHRIVFDQHEGDMIACLADGLIAGKRASPLDGRTLMLTDTLFADDALIWDPVRSQAVTYGAPDGPKLRIAFPDTPQLGIWSKPGAAFVCIEPWHGHADPTGFAGDLRDKPGICRIPPGGTKRCVMEVTLLA